MFNRLWKMKEGFVTGAGLILVGLALQYSVGPIDWSAFAFPINAICLVLYLAFLALIYALRHRVRLFSFFFTTEAAVPTLIYAALLTVAMGLTRQVAPHERAIDPIGLTRMLSFWPFVLIYGRLTGIVGLIAIRQILHFRLRELPSLLSHLGVFIAIVAATLGSADMERVKLTASMDMPEWRATHEQGFLELPLAIQLEKFTIDEYPPKLLIINSKTGKSIPAKNPEIVLVDKHFREGKLLKWRIRVRQNLPLAAPVVTSDTVRYVGWGSSGAVTALLVEAQPMEGDRAVGKPLVGWVTCGSYLFPFQELKLTKDLSLVMARREPERYASRIHVYTRSQKNIVATVEVNKPVSIDGWRIYQLSYDESMGRWSETSTFELVKDPWLPAVYVGIYLLLAGAVLTFIFSQKRR
ncbi:cytochrome c biogenesis protein ResB [uncultured Porphyromonas sp.]|uniref:cytochrome c biogenesis protein ResB n=1 Tax=uncultured Porphyromonas sp. TaxID=159274 RepID=UPI00260594DA|nr:cytochrome c biogenesis protein ResB [uncultured Porphyromonas sp.]